MIEGSVMREEADNWISATAAVITGHHYRCVVRWLEQVENRCVSIRFSPLCGRNKNEMERNQEMFRVLQMQMSFIHVDNVRQ